MWLGSVFHFAEGRSSRDRLYFRPESLHHMALHFLYPHCSLHLLAIQVYAATPWRPVSYTLPNAFLGPTDSQLRDPVISTVKGWASLSFIMANQKNILNYAAVMDDFWRDGASL